MKLIIKTLFTAVRLILGPFMLLWEKLTTPKGIQRPAEKQQQIDAECRELVLYQFKTCPFCLKVRRTIRSLSLNIELRDAQHNTQHRSALLKGGGQVKAPCLRITDAHGRSLWLYESSAIQEYLQRRFAA